MKLAPDGRSRPRLGNASANANAANGISDLGWVGGGREERNWAGARDWASRDLTGTTTRRAAPATAAASWRLLLPCPFPSLQLGSCHVHGESERTQQLVPSVYGLVPVWIGLTSARSVSAC